MKNKRLYLLFVVNVDWFFLSHRLAIAQRALEKGYKVGIATTLTDRYAHLVDAGFEVFPLTMQRSGSGIFAAFHLIVQLMVIFRKVRPDIVHLVTIKPVLLGGIAARLSRVPAMVAAISGLGYVFSSRDRMARIIRVPVSLGYRMALNHQNARIIFQNYDDQKLICELTRLPAERTALIKGSGVDLAAFSSTPLPQGRPVVMMASRLLVDKGVREFVEAAKRVKSDHRSVASLARFVLVGDMDAGNAACLKATEVEAIRQAGVVEIWGHREKMQEVLPEATIVVLPSYREGFPKVLIEAAACARPVITTDVPGCRDAIVNGVTGKLVPAHDADSLAECIAKMLETEDLPSMGQAARRLAEESFDERIVVQHHIDIYESLQLRKPV